MRHKSFLLSLLLGLLFVITRWYIWVYRPVEFTEIIYSYMPYAHLWAGGTIPYLQQWFEYPPGTIPLFYIPHLIDMATLKTAWHINYLNAYRGILLLADMGIFSLLWLSLRTFKVSLKVFSVALIYYCLATAKAHHFIYDSMDLTFAGAMLLGVTAPLLWQNWAGRLVGWLGFFTAAALKLVNAPLGLVYAVLERKRWKQLLFEVFAAGVIIWSIPLVLYRSSLSVILVYHSLRGLQVESVPAQIVATINRFTRTEEYKEVYKNYDITGPVSSQVKRVYDVLFPLSLFIFIGWGTWIAWKAKGETASRLRILLTIGYLYCFMLFAKVLSTPFLLWQIPILAVYPFRSLKKQLMFIIPSFFIIIISMTKIPNYTMGIFNLHLFIGWARSLIIGYLLWQSVCLIRSVSLGKRSL